MIIRAFIDNKLTSKNQNISSSILVYFSLIQTFMRLG